MENVEQLELELIVGKEFSSVGNDFWHQRNNNTTAPARPVELWSRWRTVCATTAQLQLPVFPQRTAQSGTIQWGGILTSFTKTISDCNDESGTQRGFAQKFHAGAGAKPPRLPTGVDWGAEQNSFLMNGSLKNPAHFQSLSQTPSNPLRLSLSYASVP